MKMSNDGVLRCIDRQIIVSLVSDWTLDNAVHTQELKWMKPTFWNCDLKRGKMRRTLPVVLLIIGSGKKI